MFWLSVTVALSDTFLMFSTIPFITVPSAPTTTLTGSGMLRHGSPHNLHNLAKPHLKRIVLISRQTPV